MVCLALSAGAGAQEWPQKAVRIIVPFPAGGSADVLPRIIGEKLAQQWGQPVIVDNRPGAAGNIGAERGVPGRARRLHAALRAAAAARDQSPAVSEARLRLDAVRADDGDRARSPTCCWCTRRCSANSVAGADCAREEQPGQAELRVAGQRYDVASHRGAVQVDGRRIADRARAVQGHGAGARRLARRAGRPHVRQPRRVAAARGSRASCARSRSTSSIRLSTLPGAPTLAETPAGIRIGGLVRHRRAAAARVPRSPRRWRPA